MKQIASGLMAAHEHDVVHRDLKPQNIFVLKVAGSDHDLVKIVDFGISKISAVTATITSASTVIGTAQYMSPEQALGRIEQIDARTDQFSLALIVYEMLTGETAFRGESVSSVVYQIVHEEPRPLVDPNGPIPAGRGVGPEAGAREGQAAAVSDGEGIRGRFRRRGDGVRGGERDDDRLAAQPAGRRRAGGGAFAAASPPRRGIRRPGDSRSRRVGLLLLRREPPAANDARASAAPSRSSSGSRRQPPRTRPRAGGGSKRSRGCPRRHDDGPRAHEARRRQTESAAQAGAAQTRAGAAQCAGVHPPRTNCSPNYYVDAQGDKHFKPECFLEKKPGP